MKNRDNRIDELQDELAALKQSLREASERSRDLAADKDFYQNLLLRAPVGIFQTDKEGNCELVNDRWCEIFGVRSEQARGNGWVDAVHPDDRALVLDGLKAAMTPGGEASLEYRLTRAGEITWVQSRCVEIRGDAGTIRGRLFTITDISDRKRGEEERECLLKREQAAGQTAQRLMKDLEAKTRDLEATVRSRDESLAQLNTFFSTAPVGLALMDRDLRYVRINDALAKINGVSAEASLGRTLAQVIPDMVQEAEPMYRRVLITGEPEVNLEMAGETAAEPGKIRHWVVNYYPVKDHGGVILWVGCIIVEVTQQREAMQEKERLLLHAEEAKREAEAANKLKDEFLATVSHELRTPLTALWGWARLLKTKQVTPAVLERGIDAIERNAVAQARLVDDILDVSRIITGKLMLDIRHADLCECVQAAIGVVRPTAEAKGITLEIALDREIGKLSVDAARVQQIVWNLLANAVKFTATGGRVTIRADRRGSVAAIEVADTGNGIKAEFLPCLWDRFRQADSSTTRAHGGLGLGLAIVKYLVEAHGGSVAVSSPGEGLGATFTVAFPLKAVHDASSEEPCEPRQFQDGVVDATARLPDLDGLRVLVVDDEADARDLLHLAFHERGAEVVTTTSAVEALRVFLAFRPDVLVSDIGMPETDGYGLMRQIRALPAEDGGGQASCGSDRICAP